MKSLLNKVIILSAMAMLVGVTDAQAGNKKKKAAVQQGRVAKMVGGIRKGVSSAHEAVSSRVSGVYASGKGLVGRAGSAVANFAAAGWDKTKSVTSSVATKAKNATVATLKFAKKPAQLALGLVVAKRVIQHNEDASATSVATTAKRKLGYSK
ncbi:MAG TPA: hypothetical protein VLG71_00980 [Candidatus Limnocylindria bacterium]|nr:hypothetical protein [Candidatus Limnocylindria bacterium]